ncbi:MAG: GPR endopeptidase [Clostridia bacterium]|nr:GPR endopeptidase [Clostridia bacterium]
MCKSFQASTAGITPGSAVGKKIHFNKQTLGARVLAIGTPTVINVKNLTDKFDFDSNLVTPKNIDELLTQASECIARAIQKATE